MTHLIGVEGSTPGSFGTMALEFLSLGWGFRAGFLM